MTHYPQQHLNMHFSGGNQARPDPGTLVRTVALVTTHSAHEEHSSGGEAMVTVLTALPFKTAATIITPQSSEAIGEEGTPCGCCFYHKQSLAVAEAHRDPLFFSLLLISVGENSGMCSEQCRNHSHAHQNIFFGSL